MQLIQAPSKPHDCLNLINGRFVPSKNILERHSPYTGNLISKIHIPSDAEINSAIDDAHKAFMEWRKVPIKERTQFLFKFREILIKRADEFAQYIALESGKTPAEGKAGLYKGIEVIEFALSLQNQNLGGILEVSRGVTCETRREPLGVVVGITPFNFPAMVPLWMFPIAVSLGNSFILKPSEKVAITPQFLGQSMIDAGFPAGVFSIINGTADAVNSLINNKLTQAVAFVGSSPVAKSLYAKATSLGKRALCLGGAKNYSILVPDADVDIASQAIVDSFTGCSGQRCMALSLLVAVGEVDSLVQKIVARAKTLEVGCQMGAIIDQDAKARILKMLDEAERQGGKIILDGRKATPPKGHESGCWLGPTIIDHAPPSAACVREEIFGPVLTIVRKKTLGEAMCMENGNQFGNATSVFTTSGSVARYVCDNASSGMVAVNIGVPVPREPFSFGGTKESKYGHGDITGDSAVEFWTYRKKITTKWTKQSDMNWMN